LATDLIFDLSSADGQTVVPCTHAGWREPVEFMYRCSLKWAYYLLGLKAGLEGRNVSQPVPADRKVSTSCLVIIAAGLPSTSTTAAPAFSMAVTAELTGSPEPTIGSGADM
jgi:hypothetical protein